MKRDESRQVQLLAFEGELVRWALPTEDVLRVIEERDWHGSTPLDAAQVARIAVSQTLQPVRVLLLASGPRQVPVRVRGPLSLCAVRQADLLQLPAEFGGSSVTTRVAVEDGRPTLIVLDAARLAAAVTHSPATDSAPVAESEGSR